MTPLSPLLLLLFLLLPAVAAADCTCEAKDSKAAATAAAAVVRYKLAGLGAILGAGGVGVALPLVGRQLAVLSPDNDVFFMIKAFAAGVILATGFIHILPDAFDSLTSSCLPAATWRSFPFAGLIAMMTSIGSLMVESLAAEHSRRVHFRMEEAPGGSKVVDEERDPEHAGHVHVHTHATHGHAHGGSLVVVGSGDVREEVNKLELIRHRITAKVLELGIVVHSVIIGISLGTTTSIATIKPLMTALCFHQFFEGMGLGGCISQAKFKTRAMAMMALFFSLTTPIGVAIGIGISGVYKNSSPTSLIVQGVFESAAAGILIYMALVDLLATDFMNPRLQKNTRIQLGSHISLLLGAGCMSVLAKWA